MVHYFQEKNDKKSFTLLLIQTNQHKTPQFVNFSSQTTIVQITSKKLINKINPNQKLTLTQNHQLQRKERKKNKISL